MGQDPNSRLAELAALCKRQRLGSKRPRYNEETKSLARELAAGGVERASVARAAGVSSYAVRTWLKVPAVQRIPKRRPVRILNVDGGGGAADKGRMVMMIRVADFDVAIYSREEERL